MSPILNYSLVTAAYWAFTLTDGALRMLVLLHFHQLGYTPFELASLFLFYEFFGVVTNLLGGWIGANYGLKTTLVGGLAIQVIALVMLSFVSPLWPVALSVTYVMVAQALSGIAKDLTKMSAKSGVKFLVPKGAESTLFKWVAILTGSKNALKGVGFFLGGILLSSLGFVPALLGMAGLLFIALLATAVGLPTELGMVKAKVKFKTLFSMTPAINILSAARLFLFGSRDVWFVVGLPVFLQTVLGWSFEAVGAFLAAWIIGYGIIQSLTPGLLRKFWKGHVPQASTVQAWAFILAVITSAIALGLRTDLPPNLVVTIGLMLFGMAFAVNSAVHSYLILAYAEGDKVALNVGFYYMANAGGRLVGTILSGCLYQWFGIVGCLWASVAFVASAGVISWWLPSHGHSMLPAVAGGVLKEE